MFFKVADREARERDFLKKLEGVERDLMTEKEKCANTLAEVVEKKVAIAEAKKEVERKEALISHVEGKLEEKETELKKTRDDLIEKERELHISLKRTKELGIQLDHSNPHSTERIFIKGEQKQAMLMRELEAAKTRIKELEEEVVSLRAQLHKKAKKHKAGDEEKEENNMLTHRDLQMIIEYIDSIGDDEDGEISITEFEHAVRMCRRARGCAQVRVSESRRDELERVSKVIAFVAGVRSGKVDGLQVGAVAGRKRSPAPHLVQANVRREGWR